MITTTASDRIFLTNVRSFLALQSTTQVLHYIDIVLVGKWDITAGGPTRIIWHASSQSLSKRRIATSTLPEYRHLDIWSKLTFGFTGLVDNRGASKPWESKGTPFFSTSDPGWIPSRSRFLTSRILRVVVCYLFLDLLTANAPEDPARIASPDKIDLFGRLHNVTVEEIATRVVSTTITLAAVIALINLVYDTMSVFAVAVGASQPKDWRPMINSPWEAYTVRRFWRYLATQIEPHIPVPG